MASQELLGEHEHEARDGGTDRSAAQSVANPVKPKVNAGEHDKWCYHNWNKGETSQQRCQRAEHSSLQRDINEKLSTIRCNTFNMTTPSAAK